MENLILFPLYLQLYKALSTAKSEQFIVSYQNTPWIKRLAFNKRLSFESQLEIRA